MGGTSLTAFEEGLVVGLLIGEGHFGGDGRKPQVTVRMHVRHESLLRWLHERFPRSRLYGPYHHGDRHYFQWMARGRALSEDLMPILDRHIRPELDGYAHERLATMRERYPRAFAGEAGPAVAPGTGEGATAAPRPGGGATGDPSPRVRRETAP
ncbi:MAG: hypothetical protein ACR2IP_02185 [Solirubrobacteraceae bacterium]